VDRLVKVRRPTTAVAYTYDGDDNKVEEIVTQSGRSETVSFLNDASLRVVLQQERMTGKSLLETTRYAYGLDLISEELASPQLGLRPRTFFYHSDGLGSTVALTDTAGAIQAHYRYDAWGQLEADRRDNVGDRRGDEDDRRRAKIPNRFLFTGEERDPYTDLYYLRARWYDPGVGRFLTTDPVCGSESFPQNLNAYTYALNNPVNLVDPNGEWPSFLKKAVHKVYSGIRAVARNPVGGFLLKLGANGLGCWVGGVAGAAIGTALGDGPGALLGETLGSSIGCALGAAGGELLVAGLRGEFGCGQNGKIFGRALLAASFGAAVGAFNPSLVKNGADFYANFGSVFMPGTVTATTLGARALGITIGQEAFGGLLIRGMSGATKAMVSSSPCNPDAPGYHDPGGPRASPLSIGAIRAAK
jgi:RHS repeat-associated protein